MQIIQSLLFYLLLVLQAKSKLKIEQQQQIACTISEETEQDPERVFTSSGVYCGQDISHIDETQTIINQTQNKNDEEYYDYFVVLHDPYSADGSLDQVKEVVETENFEEAIQKTVESEDFGEGFSVEEIAAVEQIDKPTIPNVKTPEHYSEETNITLNFMGADNTLGFIFVGLAELTTQGEPEKEHVQFNQNFNFSAHTAQFFQKNAEKNITFKGLTPCTEYKYYWVASNEDPQTYQYSTDVQSSCVNTTCIEENACLMNAICISLLLLIFLLQK